MKKVILLILSLMILLIVPITTGCGSLSQVAFDASVTGGQVPLNVIFTNQTKGVKPDSDIVFDWDFGDGNKNNDTTITDTISHEYTKAGTFIVTLTGHVKDAPAKNTQATLNISITHGVVGTVKVHPETVELFIGQTQAFTGEAFDNYGNPVPEAALSWKEGDIGTVNADGVFTAGTVAGDFSDGLFAVAELASNTAQGSPTIIIKPDPLDNAGLSVLEVAAGETRQLVANGKDKYGNYIEGLEASWSIVDARSGTVNEDGLFTASKKSASYDNAIKVKVKQGDKTCEATGRVVIVPGDMTQVGIAPERIDLGKGMTQQFVAVGADKYGNRIADISCTWNAQKDVGTITGDGLFTAGNDPGYYANAVTVEATHVDTSLTRKAAVTIDEDRFLFLSNREDETKELYRFYIADIDSENEEEYVFNDEGSVQDRVVSSKDGRRILYINVVYNQDETITDYTRIANTDGTWAMTITSGRMVFEPSISPDGQKIVFQSWETEQPEIYVMDIDGNNFVRLTNNSQYDDYPDWSPDGTKIVYVSRQNVSLLTPKIYIMNADGSEKRQLTESYHYDTLPQWSPDGTEILFQSNRMESTGQGSASLNTWGIYVIKADGSDVQTIWSSKDYNAEMPRWSPDGSKIIFCSNMNGDQYDIYTIDRDGSNLVRVTDTPAADLSPTWLNPKQGVKVDVSSVMLQKNFDEPVMTAQEISNMTKDAVVRIESKLESGTASGTGFIIKPDGLILTNNHVISGAKNITVFLPDGEEYTGTVLARDMIHDLALVKIENAGLSTISIENLGGVGTGQQVIVLGYPLGNKNVSVTSGLVSSIEYDDGRNTTWIHTDSAINPGNSGGPLLDVHGNVIGVVTAKMFGVGIEGMGYAISANTALMYLAELLEEAGITD